MTELEEVRGKILNQNLRLTNLPQKNRNTETFLEEFPTTQLEVRQT